MHGRPAFSAVRRWGLAAALVLLQLSAHAVEWRKGTDFFWSAATGNITAFPGPGSDKIWTDAALPRAPTASGPEFTFGQKQLPFNPSPTANFKARFKAGDIAKAIAKPTAGLLMPIIAGAALSNLMNLACTRLAGGVMQLAPGAQWEECNMVTASTTMWMVNSIPAPSGASQNGAVPEAARATREAACLAWPQYEYWWMANRTAQYDAGSGFCYLYSNGNYVTGRGTQSVGNFDTVTQDGYKPATPEKAETLLTSAAENWTQADFAYGYQARRDMNLSDIMDGLMNFGGSVQVDSISATGPASKVGTPETSTTTNPDGSTTTTTKTPTTTYTYNNPTTSCSGASSCNITITASTTTQTTTTVTPAGGGTPTTTTKTETKTDDPVDECKANPTAVRCMQLGDPTASDTLSKSQNNVTITPASFAGGNGCPAPVSFSAFNRSYSLEYTPLCNKLALLAPLFLALSALLAAYIFADGFKVS